ncbi:hypothetical protein JW992_08980 [candidate division KSB1 bacterium]|nr:hypothetical protein [candidate division KSB1 bacterium]
MKTTKSEIRAYILVIGLVWATMGLTQPLSGTVAVGYNDGAGVLCETVLPFPPHLRLAIGYTGVNPGRPERIRDLFLPAGPTAASRAMGSVLDLRIDYLRPVHWFDLELANFFIGPRLAYFNARFDYPADSQTLNLNSRHWGFGFGLEKIFPLSRHTNLVLSHGFDYFFLSQLESDESIYRPNDQNRNPRPGVAFADVNDVVHQPVFEIRWMIGITYTFTH